MSAQMKAVGILSVAAGLTLFMGCEKSGDFLFPGKIDGVPGIVHIEAEGGGAFTPAQIDDRAAVLANTMYTEIGPTGDTRREGLTVEFIGTGGTVCAFVDPEMVAWGQSVSAASPVRRWRLPDNAFDDGDIDMQVGLSLYYRGTPGQEMGGFQVEYQDGLGNDVEVELVSCRNRADVLGNVNIDAHAGKGTAEYCSIENTQQGVRYTVALEGFSLPIDDRRLALGLLIAKGPCVGPGDDDGDGSPDGLINRISPVNSTEPLLINEECLIMGEGLKPKKEGAEVFYSYAEGRSWPGSEQLEDHFCTHAMNQFCNVERMDKEEAGVVCSLTSTGPDLPDEERCYCGDNRDTPNGGALEF